MNVYTDPSVPPTVRHGETFQMRLRIFSHFSVTPPPIDWSISIYGRASDKANRQSNGNLAAPNGWGVTNVTPGPLDTQGFYYYLDVTVTVPPRCYSVRYVFIYTASEPGTGYVAPTYQTFGNSSRIVGVDEYADLWDFTVACELSASIMVTGASSSMPNVPYQGAAQTTPSSGVSPYTYNWSVSSLTGQATITSGLGMPSISFSDYTTYGAVSFGTYYNHDTTTTVTCRVDDDAGCYVIVTGQYVTHTSQERGCMDVRATNYDPSAVFDDGSCVYRVGTPHPPGRTPALLGRPSSHYNRAATALDASSQPAGILFWRSDRPVPLVQVGGPSAGRVWDTRNGAQGVLVTSTAGDNSPRLAEDYRRLLFLLFIRPARGAMLCRSGDDGDTWEPPLMAISGGTHPNIVSQDGRTLAAACVNVGTSTAPVFHIQARAQGPGDPALGTLFTFNDTSSAALHVADDSFGLAFAAEGPSRLALHVLIAGETITSDWWSANDGRSWTRV